MMKLLTVVFLLILSACGMQGDLYLPEEGSNSSTQERVQGSEVDNVEKTKSE